MKYSSNPLRLSLVAAGEWLLVLPATLLLAAAALRQMQPAQHEPARTISLLFNWAVPHISRSGAALLFIGLPGIVAVAGCVMLVRLWRGNETLRQDVSTALASLRRHLVVCILASATLLACAILAAVFAHIITD